ncbi:MAG: DUF6785 family protein [Armatimonadota bacterium]
MTRRALSIGIISVLLIAVATPYTDLVVQGTWLGLTSFPISAFFVLAVLAGLLNVIPRALGVGLTTAELLVVYSMMLVGAGIPSFGLTGLLIPYMAGPFYFATEENEWAETLWPLLPDWLHPPAGQPVEALYEGLRPGAAVPWGAWGVPLLAWTALAAGVYAVFFCLTAILRRRWVDDEKLVFPLIQLPVEMAEYDSEASLLPELFTNRIMWAFFAVPFIIHTINGLHFYIPAMPSINVHQISLDPAITERPWTAVRPLRLRILFSIIGLAFILPAELSFSLWLFYFLFLGQQVVGEALGAPMPSVQAYPVRQFVAHQMTGGILCYLVLGLLAARERLRQVWAEARRPLMGGPRERGTDRREPMPYATAVWGMFGGLGLIVAWGVSAGASAAAMVVLFVLYFAMHVIAVRLVCEGGMLYVQHPFRPLNIMLAAVGTGGLGRRTIAITALLDHLLMLDNRSPLMPSLMQSMRIAEDGGISRRGLFGALAVSVGLATVVSCVVYLWLMYRHGGTALNTWFTSYYTRNLYCTWTNHLIVNGEPPEPWAFARIAIGAGSMWALVSLHRTYLWWPLHPIGYLMGASWPMINFWFPILIGWMLKSAVVRFGGHRVYRRLLPGFLGLIFGEFLSAGLWAVVDIIAGVRGHVIFSF